MLDRASSFADAEVIALLRERFVPLALDVWYEERRADAAGELYRKIVLQREGTSLDRTTQGFYAFLPDGTLLEGWNHRGVDRLKERLAQALAEYKATAKVSVPAETAATDRRFDRPLPDGARVVAVRARVLEAQWSPLEEGLQGEWQRAARSATSLDHLWILRDEIAELAAGTFPPSLAWRIARFHCVDNTRGEPPSFEPDEVEQCEVTLASDGAVDGTIALRSKEGERRFDARVGGTATVRDGALDRFDLAIRGTFTGQGQYMQGGPLGPFTLAIVLSLARDHDHPEIPPQGARWLDDYLGKVNGRDGTNGRERR